MGRILCVAEKPAIAKSVAQHLSGGQLNTRSIPGNPYVKNYEFHFNFGRPWGDCPVTMTSVIGHLSAVDFGEPHRRWAACPPAYLFEAPLVEDVDKQKIKIAENIRNVARYSSALFIWTDCDREGEHIGTEIRTQARASNPRIEVKRAWFSNTERAHILWAAAHPIDLNENQANAVAARIELDLRIGAAFTRLQTLQLKTVSEKLEELTISYGSCQFPTLGFVVDRYFRVKSFKPETFWLIKVSLKRDGIMVNFSWRRVNLFDRAAVVILFERCLLSREAKVIKVNQKPTSKWRPLPLTTVDLQMMGSRYLRIDSQKIMKIAETLYTRGFISYPRTETDQFDKGIDLKKFIDKQIQDLTWGAFAQRLMNDGFKQPRAGRHNDKAHPPIHPVTYVVPGSLTQDERKVYEFVVRRFLACCAEDAKGQATDIDIQYGPEYFHAHGLLVLERNYLDVYVYDKWESSQQLPEFRQGETFEPTEAKINEGQTVAPGYLTEPELIGLMDANGIGTDSTMAEHIAKISNREYVGTQLRGSGKSATKEFIPTQLGMALVKGYDDVVSGLPDCPSLSKPFLRKEMELRMVDISEGRKAKMEVVSESVNMYREVFVYTQQRINMLKAACRRYVVENHDI